MNIQKYTAYFHDGSIIGIKHFMNSIEISMESAEMAEEDLIDPIILSKHDTIKGKLHLEGVSSITIGKELHIDKLIMKHDCATIFDFEIGQNYVELQLDWINFPPKPHINDFSVIRIDAEKIYWENIPDLFDPFE